MDEIPSLLADGESQASVDGAAMSGVVIGRLEVGGGTLLVAGLADGSRARALVAAGVGGLDGETVGGED